MCERSVSETTCLVINNHTTNATNATMGIVIKDNVTLSTFAKYALTFGVYFCFFAYGLGYSIVSPVLLTLCDQLGSSFEEVSRGVLLRSFSFCIGSLIGEFFRLFSFAISQLFFPPCLPCSRRQRSVYVHRSSNWSRSVYRSRWISNTRHLSQSFLLGVSCVYVITRHVCRCY